ncbi:DUF2878 domain-containing protein [Ferrimonas pelagia]|uniref:DUF2878 domain-containing protein n=1 Tax=Ferrimonas pelagia TaxID=1177826 RepID=A0ABP9FCF3_9GAMM
MSARDLVLTSTAFNGFWLLAVWGQWDWPLLLGLAAVWLRWPRAGLWALPIALVGVGLDSLWTQAGVFRFEQLPGWLLVLWLGFGTYAWALRRVVVAAPSHWLALIGACAGAMSYWAGVRLGAVSWPMGLVPTLSLLWLEWFLLTLAIQAGLRRAMQSDSRRACAHRVRPGEEA